MADTSTSKTATVAKRTPRPCVLREEQAHKGAPHLAPCGGCHALSCDQNITRPSRCALLTVTHRHRYYHQDTLNVIHQSFALQLLSVPCQNIPISTMMPVSPGAPTPGQPTRMSSIRSHVPQLRFLLLPSLTRNYLTVHMRHARPHLCPKAKHELTCPRQTYPVYLRATGILRSSPSPCRPPTQSTCTPRPDLAGLFYHAYWASLPRSAQLWCSHWPISHPCAIYGRVCMRINRVSCARRMVQLHWHVSPYL